MSTTTLNTLVNRSTVGAVNTPSNYRPPAGNLYNFSCDNSGTQTVGSGSIYSVSPGMIQIRNNNGGISDLRLSGCSNL